MIAVEIFLSFLVTFAVVTLGVHGADNYRRPLGFSWQDVWNVQVDTRAGNIGERGETIPPELLETFRQVLAAVREFPEVVAVGGATCPPYGHSEWTIVVGHRHVAAASTGSTRSPTASRRPSSLRADPRPVVRRAATTARPGCRS